MASIIFIVFWFVVIAFAFFVLIVRPQRRRMAAHQALVDGVEVGNQLITTGGLIGEVVAIEPATLRLKIDDGVVVHIARGAIAQVIPDLDDEAADGAATTATESTDRVDADSSTSDPQV